MGHINWRVKATQKDLLCWFVSHPSLQRGSGQSIKTRNIQNFWARFPYRNYCGHVSLRGGGQEGQEGGLASVWERPSTGLPCRVHGSKARPRDYNAGSMGSLYRVQSPSKGLPCRVHGFTVQGSCRAQGSTTTEDQCTGVDQFQIRFCILWRLSGWSQLIFPSGVIWWPGQLFDIWSSATKIMVKIGHLLIQSSGPLGIITVDCGGICPCLCLSLVIWTRDHEVIFFSSSHLVLRSSVWGHLHAHQLPGHGCQAEADPRYLQLQSRPWLPHFMCTRPHMWTCELDSSHVNNAQVYSKCMDTANAFYVHSQPHVSIRIVDTYSNVHSRDFCSCCKFTSGFCIHVQIHTWANKFIL